MWDAFWQSLRPIFDWAQANSLGIAMRDSVWAISIIAVIHLIGLTILLGSILVLCLRLTGLALRGTDVAEVSRAFAPWTTLGLIIMLLSGGGLFLIEPNKCFGSDMFRIKMVFFFSALLFHFTLYRKVTRAEEARYHPWLHKATAVVASVLWLGVGIAGRAIGFF